MGGEVVHETAKSRAIKAVIFVERKGGVHEFKEVAGAMRADMSWSWGREARWL